MKRFGRGGPFGGRHHSHHHHHGEEHLSMKRLLRHGDLRAVILYLLEEKPRHGYDLIKALEELSSGAYSPSPGTIYPTLTFLEESELATAETKENKKLYSITKQGTKWLEENREPVDFLLKRFSEMGERMSRFKHMMGQMEAEAVSEKDKSPIRKAMHALKAELFHFMDANKEEKQKVASIIERAVEDLRKLKA